MEMERFEGDSEWFWAQRAKHTDSHPALREYGTEILVAIDETRRVAIHNGIDVLASWQIS